MTLIRSLLQRLRPNRKPAAALPVYHTIHDHSWQGPQGPERSTVSYAETEQSLILLQHSIGPTAIGVYGKSDVEYYLSVPMSAKDAVWNLIAPHLKAKAPFPCLSTIGDQCKAMGITVQRHIP